MTGAAYVVFDGDNDKWAYAYMNGWKANRNIDFTYQNAHDLDTMTGRAQDEQYVKSKLRERMKQSSAVVVLIGEKTKNLYKYVRWELELALELGLPIIAANLNETNRQDANRCPAYKLVALKYAMANWPSEFSRLSYADRTGGARHYTQFDAS
ncbi:TIR domain-containing protein [Rhodomicrobium lacus]|uniref:TIR domain-containing protein n=1 Tax=Rhodomicrobium lacus TaxID=2498452 RepID=UPI0026E1E1AB|nr:TIR domain-containing protein [Rhodomicrobium lacus]WKW52068.1 TIR domain-containing protein [Rhodomicrobium lacus]